MAELEHKILPITGSGRDDALHYTGAGRHSAPDPGAGIRRHGPRTLRGRMFARSRLSPRRAAEEYA